MPNKKFFVGVKALITNAEGNILVMKRVPNKPEEKWRPFWDIPGGRIQDDGIKETLIREVEEELGVSNLEIGDLYDVAISNFDIEESKEPLGLFFVIYRCKIPKNSKLKLSEEHSEYKWASPDDAKRLLAFMLPEPLLEKIVRLGL